jgi:hypothetical protein
MDRQNVKPKFAKVSASATETTNSARSFVSECCATDNPKPNPASSDQTIAYKARSADCTRLRSDNQITDKPVKKTKTEAEK